MVKAHIFVNFNVCFKRHTCCAHGCWTWQQKMVVNFQYEQNCFSSKMWSFSLMFIHTKFRDYYHQFKHRNNFVQDFIRLKIKNFHTKLIFCVIACLIYEKKRLTINIVLIELFSQSSCLFIWKTVHDLHILVKCQLSRHVPKIKLFLRRGGVSLQV